MFPVLRPTILHVPTRAALAAFALCIVASCDGTAGDDPPAPVPPSVAQTSSVVLQDWLAELYDTIRAEALSPPVASRVIGYVGVAVYETLVPGMPSYSSLGRQLNDLGDLPAAPSGEVNWSLAVNAAVADVLVGLLPSASLPTLSAIAARESAITTSLGDGVSAAVRTRSEGHGVAIAAAILDWASRDEFTLWNNCAYVPPNDPGAWVPTPPAFANPLQPCWGNLRPFALLYAAECTPLSFPPFSLNAGSAFALEALEVYDTVNALTPEQLAIALFWADNPGQTGTPPGHWVSILRQVCAAESIDLELSTEAFAKLGIALADAFISCWEIKYAYNLLRPITYIRDPAGPIQDAAWDVAPGVVTPPFPEFTSGHSVQSGAAAVVLRDVLGSFPFVDDTHAGVHPARSFQSFDEAAEEAAISRIYGGIHFRSACDYGVDQGRCIGAIVTRELRFRNQ